MFKTIGTVLTHSSKGPDRVRVRGQSRLAGRCEGTFWRRTDRREVRRVVLGARRYELAGRQAGRRNGPLGHVALEVLELLGNLVSYRTGRLDPAVTYLMEKLRRSRDAVVRALAVLRSHGFLDWLRRYEPTGHEGRGPQVRQVSNAYRLSLPTQAAQLLGRWGQYVPLPDDVAHQRQTRQQEVEAHKADLGLGELGAFMVEDDTLGRLLGRLGRLVQERESASRTETQSRGFI